MASRGCRLEEKQTHRLHDQYLSVPRQLPGPACAAHSGHDSYLLIRESAWTHVAPVKWERLSGHVWKENVVEILQAVVSKVCYGGLMYLSVIEGGTSQEEADSKINTISNIVIEQKHERAFPFCIF